MELISEGAEAKIFKINQNTLKKVREKKTYRLEVIDKKLRKSRTKREFKVLTKLFEKGLNVPEPFEINEKEFSFTFEYINGVVLKKVLDKKLLFKAFENIIKMHKQGIVHSDLTTLNMLVRGEEAFLIDFGLSEFSSNHEQRAVDLNLFFTCIRNEHPDFFKYKKELIEKYLKEMNDKADLVIKRLEIVEHRGRNK